MVDIIFFTVYTRHDGSRIPTLVYSAGLYGSQYVFMNMYRIDNNREVQYFPVYGQGKMLKIFEIWSRLRPRYFLKDLFAA
jgi:hypothetical protein